MESIIKIGCTGLKNFNYGFRTAMLQRVKRTELLPIMTKVFHNIQIPTNKIVVCASAIQFKKSVKH